MYRSTKTYGPELGLSACFRQWRADSHCRFLHGYALSFDFIFEATELNDKNWVIDFGGLATLKSNLRDVFDHRLVVAKDDPYLDTLVALGNMGLAYPMIVDKVGCEAFAELGWHMAYEAIWDNRPRVQVVSCEVREHGANSAIYVGAG